MERALGKVPHVTKAHWNWQQGLVFVRFAQGKRSSEKDLREAVDEGTRYSSGKITYYRRTEDLPDALR